MKPAQAFARHDARRFEAFLRKRLAAAAEEQPFERDERCNFEHLGVPPGDSYLDSLVKLFAALPSPLQEAFRKGLVGLLRHLSANDFSARGVADIVYLIGMTQAFSGLEPMVDVVSGNDWARKHPHLIYDLLAVLKMFPASLEVHRAAERLVTSTTFVDDFSFDACAILLRARPAQWAAAVNLMVERLTRLVARVEREGDAEERKQLARRERSLARQLRTHVPLADIARRLGDLDEAQPLVRRLFDRLFGDEGPLELVRDDKDGYAIHDRSHPERCTKVTLAAPLVVMFSAKRLVFHKRRLRHDLPMHNVLISAAMERVKRLAPKNRALMPLAVAA